MCGLSVSLVASTAHSGSRFTITCSSSGAALAKPRTWRSPASSTRISELNAPIARSAESQSNALSSAGCAPRTREVTAAITSRMRRSAMATSSTAAIRSSSPRRRANSGSRKHSTLAKAADNGFLISWPIVANTDSRMVAGVPRACSNTSRGWRSSSSCARKRRMHSSMSSVKSGLRSGGRRAGGQRRPFRLAGPQQSQHLQRRLGASNAAKQIERACEPSFNHGKARHECQVFDARRCWYDDYTETRILQRFRRQKQIFTWTGEDQHRRFEELKNTAVRRIGCELCPELA